MDDTNICSACADEMRARDEELMRLRVIVRALKLSWEEMQSLFTRQMEGALEIAATPTPRGASLAERIADAYIDYNNQVDIDCVSQYDALNQQQYNKLTVEFARAIRDIPEIARELVRREA